jgi:hypothetical protein
MNTDDLFIVKLDISLNELLSLTSENLEEHEYTYGSASGSNSSATLSNSSGERQFRKLTYADVARTFNTNDSSKFYNEIRILQTYFNGQKNLYNYSKDVTARKLNMLMVPAFVLSASGIIIVPFIMEFQWSAGAISAIYAIITFLLTLINYFKLESYYQQYAILSDRYYKLNSSLEIINNRVLFEFSDSVDERFIRRDFESKLSDITNIVVPSDVKRLFPVICNINIFSFIRKIENHKRLLIIEYMNTKNEIRYIQYKGRGDIESKKRRKNTRYQSLLDSEERLKSEIIDYNNIYNSIDIEFSREIRYAEYIMKKWFVVFFSGVKVEPISNPIIQKFM